MELAEPIKLIFKETIQSPLRHENVDRIILKA